MHSKANWICLNYLTLFCSAVKTQVIIILNALEHNQNCAPFQGPLSQLFGSFSFDFWGKIIICLMTSLKTSVSKAVRKKIFPPILFMLFTFNFWLNSTLFHFTNNWSKWRHTITRSFVIKLRGWRAALFHHNGYDGACCSEGVLSYEKFQCAFWDTRQMNVWGNVGWTIM